MALKNNESTQKYMKLQVWKKIKCSTSRCSCLGVAGLAFFGGSTVLAWETSIFLLGAASLFWTMPVTTLLLSSG